MLAMALVLLSHGMRGTNFQAMGAARCIELCVSTPLPGVGGLT